MLSVSGNGLAAEFSSKGYKEITLNKIREVLFRQAKDHIGLFFSLTSV